MKKQPTDSKIKNIFPNYFVLQIEWVRVVEKIFYPLVVFSSVGQILQDFYCTRFIELLQ
jgi:hypothetical protein